MNTTAPATTAFAQDVLSGLRATPKRLPSKYFYDDRGSDLFRQIMTLDEYYLTDAEYRVFEQQKNALLQAVQPQGKPFQLVEFGSGDGAKTKVLLQHFTDRGARFEYVPIDISKGAMDGLCDSLHEELPELECSPIVGDYFEALAQLDESASDKRKCILFLGSNIGNFKRKDAPSFFREIRRYLSPGDFLLVGVDLQKDPRQIAAAYDDAEGVTAAFNLNLLTRINRELGADFDTEQFGFYSNYNIETGEVRSYLVSKQAQQVYIEAVDEVVRFGAHEYIHTEISRKYSLIELDELAAQCGFEVAEHLTDDRAWFVDSLWRAV